LHPAAFAAQALEVDAADSIAVAPDLLVLKLNGLRTGDSGTDSFQTVLLARPFPLSRWLRLAQRHAMIRRLEGSKDAQWHWRNGYAGRDESPERRSRDWPMRLALPAAR